MARIGRGGHTVVSDLGNGTKQSVTQTPAGVRAAIHEGGVTRAVDPASLGIAAVKASVVGGERRRVTVVRDDGVSIDHTQKAGSRDTDAVEHEGPVSRTKR